MDIILRGSLIIFLFLITQTGAFSQRAIQKDIVIIGGGASGTMAGIQSARMGAEVLIVEKTEWLGGMLTAAGVSAIDGNHKLPSGLWGEFRSMLYSHYGGPAAVETGWVSNTLYEPSIGDKYLKMMAAGEKSLEVWHNAHWQKVQRDGSWAVEIRYNGKKRIVKAIILIDATELGDVAAAVDIPYDLGIESREESGESIAPESSYDLIQDLTYVATLKDYGEGVDKTIPKPKDYDPKIFHCSCNMEDEMGTTAKGSSCYQMLQYGRLPNDKYMINWPRCGNDTYLNLVEMPEKERQEELKKAKLKTLQFVYFIQKDLGFSNLGIAENEYPTADNLPMIPYHRESRRIHGQVRLTFPYLESPFDQPNAYYRTGVAVGDYPIDHHHLERKDAPKIDFSKEKIPSYNVPLGVLIPKSTENFIVAEKSISVSHIVNGATRLQPVVMGIGQAAGALAALAVKEDITPAEIPVRTVQHELLNAGVYLMPYIDVASDHPWFPAIQRIGATGIMEGIGIPYKWANQTWFYPEREISEYEFAEGMKKYFPEVEKIPASGNQLTIAFVAQIFQTVDAKLDLSYLKANLPAVFNKKCEPDYKLIKGEAAVLIDHFLAPFNQPVDITGALIEKNSTKE